MVKPTTPSKRLVRLLVSRQGSGKTRRLRAKVTAAELAEAVSLLRTCCPDADLLDQEQTRALCRKILADALAPSRIPHPDQDWDIISVYAEKQDLTRHEACVELGLAVKVKPKPKLTPIEQEQQKTTKLAKMRTIEATARRRGMGKEIMDKIAEIEGLMWVTREVIRGKFDEPPTEPAHESHEPVDDLDDMQFSPPDP